MNQIPRRTPFISMTLALWGALGTFLMSVGGLLAALQFPAQRFQHFSAWQMLQFLATLTTPLQALGFGVWVAITGMLIALGSQRIPISPSRAIAAFAAGALIPIGLIVLGHLLGKVWPDTTGPTDAPVLTLLLALYSLAMPWLLGRLVRRITRPLPFMSAA